MVAWSYGGYSAYARHEDIYTSRIGGGPIDFFWRS